MSVPQSVQRLCDDPDALPEVRQLLFQSELDGPSEQDLAKFAARMAPLVGLSVGELSPGVLPRGMAPAEIAPGGALQGGGLGSQVSGSLGLKGILAAAGLASVGLGLWWLVQSAPQAQMPTADSVREPASQVAVAEAVPAQESAVVAPEPAVLEAPAVALEQAPTLATKRSPVARVGVEKGPDELTLIAQAQGLRSQPAALLKVLKQHESLYPRGMLAQEREVLAVEALVASGQLASARRRADKLEADFPSSAHLPRIRALLGAASGN